MSRRLQSPIFATALGTVLYLLVTLLCWRPPAASPSGSLLTSPSTAQINWDFHNPEVEQLVAELNKEREALSVKAQQLQEWSVRLETERNELGQITQSVQEAQAEFDRNVVRVRDEEIVNLRKLAKVYSAMAPESATQILKQMEETTLVKLLAIMKEAEAGALLEAMAKQGDLEAKRAADLSERWRQSLPRLEQSDRATR
jgi:flagellar motility protein MotE (MotC chaperone)